MWPTAIVVFREILEIALIVGLLLAATRQLEKRGRWFVLGIVGGVIGSLVIAGFAESITNAFEGSGQEVLNAGILFTAVFMLGWTVVWMRRHGREIAQHIRDIGHSVSAGRAPMYTLSIVIALSVFREGAEIVLFTYGIAAAGEVTPLQMLEGGLIGAAGGAIVGLCLYFGILKFAQKHLFTVTSWMLAFLAAGMAASGAKYLIAAGHLPELVPQLWDTSWLIAEDDPVGQILHVLIGYSARPSGMEMVFYAGTLIAIGAAMKMSARPRSNREAMAAGA